jgi:N6-adenosine-specific RNA methylase IME4
MNTVHEDNNVALVRIEAMQRALAETRDIDEIKDIRDKAEAIRLYTKQRGYSLDIQNDAAVIKIRCERRLGELLKEIERSEGGRPEKNSSHDGTSYQQVLKENEIGHTTAHRWQLEASVPEDILEQHIEQTRKTGGEVTTVGLIKVAQARNREENYLHPPPLPQDKYDVIYADPPWQYSNTLAKWGCAELHYKTMPTEDICAMEILAADDSTLFLWSTNPFLEDALNVVEAWGFDYKTNIVWVKTNPENPGSDLKRPGSGFYVRGHHELLFVCTKGSHLPNQKGKPPISSILAAAPRNHSQKPEEAYSLIESLYPNSRYLELFARENHDGWECWGNELNREA